MYPGQVPRSPDPEIRALLVERAAQMLARREPVTLRSVVAGTGASTMAVYTHFGGMPGLWRAVRQEGFERLAARLAQVGRTEDPVRDLVALGAAYVANALEHPHLYRAMFDTAADLEDPTVADHSFGALVAGAERARASGRLAPDTDVEGLALRAWTAGHGMTLLVLSGVLPLAVLRAQSPEVWTALLVAAGDEPSRCAASVRAGWALLRHTAPEVRGGDPQEPPGARSEGR